MDWEIFNKICAGIPEEDIQTFLKASEKMLENIENSVLTCVGTL